jgi:hypothetical protein
MWDPKLIYFSPRRPTGLHSERKNCNVLCVLIKDNHVHWYESFGPTLCLHLHSQSRGRMFEMLPTYKIVGPHIPQNNTSGGQNNKTTCRYLKILPNYTLPSSSRSFRTLFKMSYNQNSAAFFVAFLLSDVQIYCQTKLYNEMRHHKLKRSRLTRECLTPWWITQ